MAKVELTSRLRPGELQRVLAECASLQAVKVEESRRDDGSHDYVLRTSLDPVVLAMIVEAIEDSERLTFEV